jgi:hypothetical protein
MPTTRTINYSLTGQFALAPSVSVTNSASTGGVTALFTLNAGDTTFTVPTAGDVHGAVGIIKPAGNTATIKFKGAAGDTGIKLHPTAPDSISLDPTQATFVLNASAPVTGMMLIWS